jgi:hypothetical protein
MTWRFWIGGVYNTQGGSMDCIGAGVGIIYRYIIGIYLYLSYIHHFSISTSIHSYGGTLGCCITI